jgi:hypothetical protein
MPYAEMALTAVFATFFAKAAEMEARGGRRNHGLLWAALSLAVSALGIIVLQASLLGLFLLQIALFVGIAVVRVMLEGREDPS